MVSWTDAQRLAVETLDKDLLITAGAGTGKTSVLVEHAVHVLRSGVPPERLLVITFTRKAADQLRERLFQAVASHPEPALRSLMPLLPRAYIGTIHGFCQRLLRESAVTAGVDPGFRILDATGSDLLLAEATREVLDRWFEDKETGSPEHAFGRLVELCHGGAEGFEGELRRLIHAVRTTADPRGTLRRYRRRYATPYRRLYLDLVKEEIVRIREAALEVSRRLEAEVSLTEKRRGLLRCVLALSRIPVPGKRVRDLWDLRGAVLATGLVEDAGGTWKIAARDPGILAVKPSFQKLRALLDEPLLSRLPADPEGLRREERRAARFGDTLGRLLEEILDAYGDAKSSRSSVDFSDLEHLTRDLLEKEAAAGIDPARRFDHVLVDEFQDVNRLQARIIDLLSRGRRHAFVGDLKQCIYQFRLSAPEIFRDMIASHEIIEDPAAVLEGRLPRPEADAWGLRIGRSFRSRPAVLDVINGIFTHLFREETLGAPYDGQRLTPGIDPRSLGVDPPGDAPVEIHVIGSRDLDPETSGGDGRESKGPPARRRSPAEREALLSAHRLRRLVGEERPRVWDKEARAWRPVRWGDVAVLLRSPGMDWGRTFLRVFRQEGIPAHLGRGTGFFDAEEIRDALNLLRILDNSLDDIPLAALLRSPVFSWTDGDLTLLRQAFPDAKYLWLALERLADGTAPGGKGGARERLLGAARELSGGHVRPLERLAAAAHRRIEGWRERLGRRELGATLAEIIRDADLPLLASMHPQGPSRRANLQKLVDLVQAYTKENGHSLRGLLAWLDAVRVESGELPQVPDEAEDGDTVRILSVHMAKGLEFPVVLVAQLGQPIPWTTRSQRILGSSEGLGMEILEPETFALVSTVANATLRAVKKRDESFEEMRILYVALTRARERLILVGSLEHGKYLKDPTPLPLPAQELASPRGRSPLSGWILPSLAPAEDLPITTTVHPASAWDRAFPGHPMQPEASPTREAVRRGDPLPGAPGRKPKGLDAALRPTRVRYPLPWLREIQGRYWVTELKRWTDRWREAEASEEGVSLPRGGDDEVEPTFSERLRTLVSTPAPDAKRPPDSAASVDPRELGRGFHFVLERIPLEIPGGIHAEGRDVAPEDLEGVVRPLLQRHGHPASLAGTSSLAPVAGFFNSEPGRSLLDAWRDRPGDVHREANFTMRLPLARMREILRAASQGRDELMRWPSAAAEPEALEDEWTLLQGQIDLLWTDRRGVWRLLDYKSDNVLDDASIAERARGYTLQIRLYEEAVRSVWGAGEVESSLYFLRTGRTVMIPGGPR